MLPYESCLVFGLIPGTQPGQYQGSPQSDTGIARVGVAFLRAICKEDQTNNQKQSVTPLWSSLATFLRYQFLSALCVIFLYSTSSFHLVSISIKLTESILSQSTNPLLLVQTDLLELFPVQCLIFLAVALKILQNHKSDHHLPPKNQPRGIGNR